MKHFSGLRAEIVSKLVRVGDMFSESYHNHRDEDINIHENQKELPPYFLMRILMSYPDSTADILGVVFKELMDPHFPENEDHACPGEKGYYVRGFLNDAIKLVLQQKNCKLELKKRIFAELLAAHNAPQSSVYLKKVMAKAMMLFGADASTLGLDV